MVWRKGTTIHLFSVLEITMKQFIRNLLLFVLPALIYALAALLFMPYLLTFANGPSTKQQLAQSFKNAGSRNYELLILGNSRAYRGINPDILSYKAFNFSHDNDSYNQLYYKLKYVIDQDKEIKYVILGTDYFQFSVHSDSRNYAYADFLGSDYLSDYKGSNILIKKIEYYVSNINPKKIRLLFSEKGRPFLRENGQYIKPGIATEKDSIQRDFNRLDLQIKYFEKTLSLCKEQDIKVFIVMLPTRQNELKSYTENEMAEFTTFIDSYTDDEHVFYLNFSENEDFTIVDYTDLTHLNEKAANRFTELLDKRIMDLIPAEEQKQSQNTP